MNFLFCVGFAVVAMLVTEVQMMAEKCFNWNELDVEKLEMRCKECAMNFTERADILKCFDDYEFKMDEEGNINLDEYMEEWFDGFHADDETKAVIKVGLKECAAKFGTKDNIDYEKLEVCSANQFSKHCGDAKERSQIMDKSEDLQACLKTKVP